MLTQVVIIHKPTGFPAVIATLMWRSYTGKLETIKFCVEKSAIPNSSYVMFELWCCDDFAVMRGPQLATGVPEALVVVMQRIRNASVKYLADPNGSN